MINILNPKFLKWNTDNSKLHYEFDSNGTDRWNTGAETYLIIFGDSVFNLSTYSNVKKEYSIDHQGVRITKTNQVGEALELDEDGYGEHHEIEHEWVITHPTGHFYITVDGQQVGVQWDNGKITDLQGNEAYLRKGKPYRVEEILTLEEEERLVEIKRLARLRDMFFDDTREMLNRKIMELGR